MIWRKWLPNGIFVTSYLLIWLILLSALGMWIGLITGNGDLSHSDMKSLLSFWYPLTPFYVPPTSHAWGILIVSGLICWSGWLFSTRIRFSNSSRRRRIAFFLFAWFSFTVLISVISAGYMKGISYDRLLLMDALVKDETYRAYLHPGGIKLLGWFFMILPTFGIYAFWSRLWSEYRSDPVIQDWFENYRFDWKYLGRFGDDKAMVMPDITLALDATKKTPVILTGDSRQLGTALIGPPGSGKTSLKIIKAFRQDLAHMQASINAFPKYVQKYGYGSDAFLRQWANHLIGSIIIEPAKDLCDKAFQLAKEHKIPEELTVYLDPTNPQTPGFNVMIGPLEQVAETLTAVFDGMSETSNEFFRQSSRTVLKQYIYLLKFLKKNECTLLELDRMYQDPRFVADMVEELQKKIPEPEIMVRLPRDKYIFWALADRTVKWFWNDGLEVAKTREGVIHKEKDGRPKFTDKQYEFTRHTRNLISDLITNPYLARILMGKNAVDLDRLMAKGGILLCNTASGELGNVSDAFGKMVLMSVQNAVFRRKGEEKTRPLVSLYVDEFYDYMNMPFLKLTGQGRKYKIAPLVACQTLSQFDIKFGNGFTDGMLGTIRNYIAYGGVGTYDAEKLSPLFGTKTVDELSIRDNITPETMTNPSYSYSESVTRTESELVTADQIMFNKFKYSYVRLVVEGSTNKAIKAEGDFVDFGKSHQWQKALKEPAIVEFLKYWQPLQGEEDSFSMDWIDEDSTVLKDLIQQGTPAVQTSPAPGGGAESPLVAQEQKKVEYIGGGESRFKEVPKSDPPKRGFANDRTTLDNEPLEQANPAPPPLVEETAGRREEKRPIPPTPAQEPPRSPAQDARRETAAASASDLLFGGTPLSSAMNPPAIEPQPEPPDPHPVSREEGTGVQEGIDSKQEEHSIPPSVADKLDTIDPLPQQEERSTPPQSEPKENLPDEGAKKREAAEKARKKEIEERRKGTPKPPVDSSLTHMKPAKEPDMDNRFFRNVLGPNKKK